jgi:hypothetical protein
MFSSYEGQYAPKLCLILPVKFGIVHKEREGNVTISIFVILTVLAKILIAACAVCVFAIPLALINKYVFSNDLKTSEDFNAALFFSFIICLILVFKFMPFSITF